MKQYMFFVGDADAPIIVDETELDTTIRLSEFGIDRDDDEVFVSRFGVVELPLK